MKAFICIVFAIASVMAEGPAYPAPAPYHPAPAYPAPAPYHPAPAYPHKAAYAPAYDEPAHYAFDYAVKDDYAYLNFGHHENRDNYNTYGGYHVALPDGRLQTVSYTVNGDEGYVAEVKYEGEPKAYAAPAYPHKAAYPAPAPYHPAPAPYHPAPAYPAKAAYPAPAYPH